MAPGGSKYFVGMPTPAAAGMLAALVHDSRSLCTTGTGPWRGSCWRRGWDADDQHDPVFQFQGHSWTRKQPSLSIVALCLMLAVVWRYSEFALVILAGTYAAVGGALHLVRFIRHRMVSRTA